MNDSTLIPSANQPVAPVNPVPKLDPVAVFSALGSEVRWPIIKMLTDGRTMSIGEIADALGRDLDGVGKQLKVLANAGVAAAFAGEDRRQTVYQIPAAHRPTPGILDYGCCLVKLEKA